MLIIANDHKRLDYKNQESRVCLSPRLALDRIDETNTALAAQSFIAGQRYQASAGGATEEERKEA